MNTYSRAIKSNLFRNVPKWVLLFFIVTTLEVKFAAVNKVIDFYIKRTLIKRNVFLVLA